MSMYLFVFLFVLIILYFIFGWKHDPYGKYKHESCLIKIGLYSTYAKKDYIILNFNCPLVNILF
jgi:hypothetical protein